MRLLDKTYYMLKINKSVVRVYSYTANYKRDSIALNVSSLSGDDIREFKAKYNAKRQGTNVYICRISFICHDLRLDETYNLLYGV